MARQLGLKRSEHLRLGLVALHAGLAVGLTGPWIAALFGASQTTATNVGAYAALSAMALTYGAGAFCLARRG